MSADPTPYDTVAYRGFAYMETHPARLAALASFYGMDPTPASRCRVLELGCGDGANLIPMAAQYPNSEFIGVDLSGRSIETGSSAIATFGLKNIALRHTSITDVTADYGLFDYIIAHGVYSWVPAEVREKMLAIFRDNLTPQGVAYVSYNAQPGSHLRDMVRDMMLFHVRGITDPQQRVGQARAVIKAIADAAAKNTIHGDILRDQLTRIEHKADAGLLHDDLDEGAVPFLLHQVVADAERHGLQYLSDASLWRRSLERLPENLQIALSQFAAGAYMARDQYHDFIDGHGFRRTLLCHANVPLDRDVGQDRIKQYYLASSAEPTTGDIDPAAPGIVEFKAREGDTLMTDHVLTKAALIYLSEQWPQAVSFEELVAAASARLGTHAEAQHACSDDQVEALAGALFRAVGNGFIELHMFPLSCVPTVSDRPQVSPLIRKQLEIGPMVTNLRHNSLNMENEAMRRFVQLVDGTRSLDQLAADFGTVVAQMPGHSGRVVTREMVEQNVKALAKMALLVG